MATSRARFSIDIVGEQILSTAIQGGVIPARFVESLDMASGTSDGQIDLVWGKVESGIAASNTTQYDLSGSLANIYGEAVVFAEVVLIAIKNTRTTALANISIGPHSSAGFGILTSGKGFWNAAQGSGGGSVVGPSSSAGPGSWYVVHDYTGVPVTATTADILSVVTSAVSGSTNDWQILIMGRSA